MAKNLAIQIECDEDDSFVKAPEDYESKQGY